MDLKKIAGEYLQDPTKITNEHYKTALDFVQEQCKAQGVCMEDFMKNKDNIPGVAKSIHSQLGFIQRKVVKENLIKELIEENYSFIIDKFNELTGNNKTKKISKKTVKK